MADDETEVEEPQPAAPVGQGLPAPAAAPAPSGDVDWSKASVLLRGTSSGTTVVCEDHANASASYPKDGAIYLRWPPAAPTDEAPNPQPVDFGIDPTIPILTLGDNVLQGQFGGISINPMVLNVVPAAGLAWAGLNLAYQKGARDITLVGLSDDEKAALQPHLDTLLVRRGVPAPGLPDIPADLSITVS